MALSGPTEAQSKAGSLSQGPELQLCFTGKPAKEVDLETQGTWEGVPCYPSTGSPCFSWGPTAQPLLQAGRCGGSNEHFCLWSSRAAHCACSLCVLAEEMFPITDGAPIYVYNKGCHSRAQHFPPCHRENNHPGDEVLLRAISETNGFLLSEMKMQQD